MTTIHHKPPARGRVAAATMLVAAGALVAGAIGTAAPAVAMPIDYCGVAREDLASAKLLLADAHAGGNQAQINLARSNVFDFQQEVIANC